MRITPVGREEMDAAHARARASRPKSDPHPPVFFNMGAALELGDTLWITFRGRAYGVPPLPWRTGQRLTALWVEASTMPATLTPETTPRYFAIIRQLARLLWAHVRLGRPWTILGLGRLGKLLLRNPFWGATDREIVELASLFLRRRVVARIGPAHAGTVLPHRPTPSRT